MKFRLFFAIAALLTANLAQAALITYSETDLASGASVSVGGTTLTTTTAGGSITFIGSGQFTGLWLGGDNSSAVYTLNFSQAISYIEIEFDALSSIGVPPVETLFNFATSNGAVVITYLNQFGTTFDGTTISSTENDGQGIISFSGANFTSFSFNHNQGQQSGFVIERLVVNTAPAAVPEPATLGLLGGGLIVLSVIRRKRAA